MKTSVRFFLMAAPLVAGLTSCQPTYLLRENFSADVIGNPPAKDIAGDPVGDRIRYPDTLIPRLTIQSSKGKAGTKALAFSEALVEKPNGYSGYLSFNGPKADLSKATRFEWTAHYRNSTGSILINVYGPQQMWITQLYLRPNGQLIRLVERNLADLEVNLGNNELLCTLDVTQPHTIFLTLNPTDVQNIRAQGHTYNIWVSNTQAGTSFSRQHLPVITDTNPTFSQDTEMTLDFTYMHESNNAELAYVFERINIVQP